MQGQLYIPWKERPYTNGASGVGAAFFPPGVNFPGAAGLDVFGDLLSQLQPMGIYTPWANRVGSMDWEVVSQPPDTNISVGRIDDSIFKEILGVGFGTPLPFLVIYTEKLPPQPQIEDALVGTSYEFYETQAVYSQQDQTDPPTIKFLHWIKVRDPGDSQGGSASLSQAAQKLGGRLGLAQQVGYNDTAARQPPTEGFQSVFARQFGAGDPSLPPMPPVPSAPGPAPSQTSAQGFTVQQLGVAAGIAVVSGLVGYAVYQAIVRD